MLFWIAMRTEQRDYLFGIAKRILEVLRTEIEQDIYIVDALVPESRQTLADTLYTVFNHGYSNVVRGASRISHSQNSEAVDTSGDLRRYVDRQFADFVQSVNEDIDTLSAPEDAKHYLDSLRKHVYGYSQMANVMFRDSFFVNNYLENSGLPRRIGFISITPP